jgi:hypothetical protein
MLISHRKKFIYTKTAKTGGTSIEVYFEPYCMPENEWTFTHAREAYVGPTGIIGYRGSAADGQLWYNHLPAREIRNQIGAAIWDEYFKFCVIRDPFDRLVSAFHFAVVKEQKQQSAQADVAALTRQFREWLPNHGKRFLDRNKYTIDGKLCVDYVIRYEQMHAGVQHVCDVLGIPFEPERIPHLKGGVRPQGIPLAEYYDAKAVSFVRDQYRFEMEHFGYAPPARAAAA